MDYLEFKELYHHGIKGQKWGVRRYENEDGTLTEEGKRRYRTKENFSNSREYQKIANKDGNTLYKMIKGTDPTKYRNIIKEAGDEIKYTKEYRELVEASNELNNAQLSGRLDSNIIDNYNKKATAFNKIQETISGKTSERIYNQILKDLNQKDIGVGKDYVYDMISNNNKLLKYLG